MSEAPTIESTVADYMGNDPGKRINSLNKFAQYCMEGRAQEVAAAEGLLEKARDLALSTDLDERYCGIFLLRRLKNNDVTLAPDLTELAKDPHKIIETVGRRIHKDMLSEKRAHTSRAPRPH